MFVDLFCKRLLVIAAAAAVAGSAGCSKSGIERAVVYGTVQYAGKPLPAGTIRFTPTDGKKTPPAAAQIIDGRYRADMRGGVPVGEHKIQIEAFRPVTPNSPVAMEYAKCPKRASHSRESASPRAIHSGSLQRKFRTKDLG